jgi:hypothetical protein
VYGIRTALASIVPEQGQVQDMGRLVLVSLDVSMRVYMPSLELLLVLGSHAQNSSTFTCMRVQANEGCAVYACIDARQPVGELLKAVILETRTPLALRVVRAYRCVMP